MKIRISYPVIVLFLLAGLCFGQGSPDPALIAAPNTGPVPAVIVVSENNVSLSYMMAVKNRNLYTGIGADFTATHFLTPHMGVTAEAEAMHMLAWDIREYAVRFGPVYRLQEGDFQPFVRALAGYSGLSATYRQVDGTPYLGGSLLLGGGGDIRIKGPMFLRSTFDFVDDWGARTRFVRGAVGVSFHMGDSGR